MRQSHSETVEHVRSEIEAREHRRRPVIGISHERDGALVAIVDVGPAETRPAVVDLPERGMTAVNLVQLSRKRAHAVVNRVLQEEPIELLLEIPFDDP